MLGTALYQRPEKAKRSAGRHRGQRPRLQSAAAPQDGSTRVSPQRCRRPPPSPRFRPSEASDARRGRRPRQSLGCRRRGPGPHLAPHPRPAAGSPGRAAARSPASFVRWALLPGRRRRPRPAPPLAAPSPGLRAAARPAAVRRSRRRPQGGIPGPSQGAQLGSPRLCFRPPWPARRVGPRAGTGGPALPPARSRGSAAASGTHPPLDPARR